MRKIGDGPAIGGGRLYPLYPCYLQTLTLLRPGAFIPAINYPRHATGINRNKYNRPKGRGDPCPPQAY